MEKLTHINFHYFLQMADLKTPKCSTNITGFPEFLLVGFHVLPELKPLLSLLFVSIYFMTVVGNVLIVAVVVADARLQSPMYFFLSNLSFLEIWYTSTTFPTLLGGVLSEGSMISFSSCITQLHVFGWLATTECFLLTLMAYDRYVAICFPLHYSSLMDHGLCLRLVFGTWVTTLMPPSITAFLLCKLQFSAYNEIDHFFCEFAPLLKVACSDTVAIELEAFVLAFSILSFPFLLIIVSYGYIISAILRIPSATGRHRAFSTCSSHLAVVATYFGTLITMYVVPSTGHTRTLNKALSLLYTVATPMLNPLIYTLRNKEIRVALRKGLSGIMLPKM
ncbi:olfactory receptor 11A1-like [Ambystoma mexicanum]|uniref:olfactory receptor 11A1-like n=1 Tax=Ambystoma mexicanum TaxID=8296 RepID=UPI0037E8160F